MALLWIVYLIHIIVLIPMLLLILIGSLVIYGIFLAEKTIIRWINNEDLSDIWTEWVEDGYDVWHEFVNGFLKRLEL
jgi:hypothetical protein